MVDNKIKMYFSSHCDILLDRYQDCFDYFEIKNISSYNPYKHPRYIQTTTPFVFITQECKNMINFIEKKENTNFYNFLLRKKYTEFFLYFAWICSKNQKDNYIFLDKPIDNTIIGPADPIIFDWNTWEAKNVNINKYNPSTFSISGKCVSIIDDNYKNNIKKYINTIFNNEMINDTIENVLNS